MSFYRGIYCHNCCEEGHYSTSCTRPVVGRAQREANKRAINELQRGYQQYPRGPSPALGPSIVPAVPVVAAASGKKKREEQGGWRMNNIGSANVVILKRPTMEEADNNFEDYTYSVTAKI